VFFLSVLQLDGQGPTDVLNRALIVFDRRGNVVTKVKERGLYSQPVFSDDGTRLAVVKVDAQTQNQDIWIIDLSNGISTRVTSDPAPEATPVWSPDGAQIAFVSTRDRLPAVYRTPSTGNGNERLLYRHTGFGMPMLTDWSADGHALRFLDAINISGGMYVLP